MADPKIRYDIVANAEGEQDVNRLASALEKVDDALDPEAAARAKVLSAQLRELGQQQAAVDTFTRLKGETQQARAELEKAQFVAQDFARALKTVEEPARADVAQMERLREAVKGAKAEVEQKTRLLDTARTALTGYGVATDQLASTETRLKTSLQATRAEIQQLGQQGAATQAFTQLVQATENARERFDAADRSLEGFRRSLDATAEPTLAQTRLLQRLESEAKATQIAFQQASLAQAQQATTLRAAGVDTDRLVAAQQRLPPQLTATAAAARQVAGAYTQAGTAATASAAGQVRANDSVRNSLDGLQQQLRTVQSLAAVAIGGGVLTGIARDAAATADAYANLGARIRIVTGEGQAFDEAFEGVFDVATRTGTAVEQTGTLFTRLAQAGKDAGLGVAAATQQALALTETINQAVQVSGSSADASSAAITQLIQGLQSGVLRGEEFNSVMEQAPRLARALAEGLGVTTGELRKLANQGALTADVVIKALQGQASTLKSEFDQLPLTVGRAIQNLSTEWTRYVGETDKATGASSTAAKAIGLLAGNLSTVASAVTTAGQAWIGYKALDLAGVFSGQLLVTRAVAAAAAEEARARGVATVATAGQTVAINANSTAKSANVLATRAQAAADATAAASTAASTAGLAAKAGLLTRIAGAAGLAGTAVLLFGDLVLDGARKVGEGVARLAGYRDRSQEIEDQNKLTAASARAFADAQAEAAAKTQLADEKALGLTQRAKGLVAQFDDLRAKGSSAGEAVEKLGKDLQLGDISGIQAAGAALDALGQRGKLSGEQIRAALQKALDGKDLAIFEAQARAAFDGSEQGARRLAAALDASLAEALRRTGKDLGELTTGLTKSMVSALNDVDLLTNNLERLREQGIDTGAALAASLDKAGDAATTENAVLEVIRRWEELGEAGKVTGEQLTAGLEKARGKLDELRAGVNSVAEAYKTLGIKSKAELDRIAEANRQAWALIRNDATASLATKTEAFKRYAESAIAANGGVATSEIKVAAEALKLRVEVDETGKTVVRTMGEAQRAAQGAASGFGEVGNRARGVKGEVDLLAGGFGQLGAAVDKTIEQINTGLDSVQKKASEVRSSIGSLGNTKAGAPVEALPTIGAGKDGQGNLEKIDSIGDLIRNTPTGGTTRTVDTGQAVNRPRYGEWTYVAYGFDVPGYDGSGKQLPGGWKLIRNNTSGNAVPGGNGFGGPATGNRQPSAAPSPSNQNNSVTNAGSGEVVTLRLDLGGNVLETNASGDQAQEWLRQLERARSAGA